MDSSTPMHLPLFIGERATRLRELAGYPDCRNKEPLSPEEL